MYKPNMKRLDVFLATVQDLWIKLLSAPYPIAAAINGHAPAGGCLISLCCEYRTMVSGQYRIGLNEAAMGVGVGKWMTDLMSSIIGWREAELAFTTGRMFLVDEALKVGLIDDTASDKADAIEKSKKFIRKFDCVSPVARNITKQRIRANIVSAFRDNIEADFHEFKQMFSLRLLRTARHVSVRGLSNQKPFVNLIVDDEGIATLTMQRPAVNSLNLELMQQLNIALDDVEKSKAKGLIITSAWPSVFSAGLDITEMYKPNIERLDAFLATGQDLWINLLRAPYPVAAAINGHAPAGGCLISLCCEYRTMVSGQYGIGLNEAAVGVGIWKWMAELMSSIIGRREAELAFTTGRMFLVDEALKAGLIDETASDKADAIEKSKKFIRKFDDISPIARNIAKQRIRENIVSSFLDNREADFNEFRQIWLMPEVQNSMGNYLQKLKKKKAAK